MSELLNFPFLNQRADRDANAEFDCVPTSLAAGANYLLGKSAIDDAAMKDALYGSGYVGGTAASAYADYLKARGIHIYPINGAYPDLLKQAHQHLAAGHPVVFTRDDPYAPGHPDWSHVCVWYKDTANSLTAMDPYGAQAITMSDASWLPHLRFNEFWVMELENTVIDINNAWVAGYFKQVATNPNRWHCAKTGFDLFAGILAGWQAMNGAPRLPTGKETPCGKQAVYQECESGIVLYDPAHEIDAPSGPWAPCYLLKLDSPLAKQLLGTATPAPVDTTQAVADVQSIADDVAKTLAASVAKAVLTINKIGH